MAQMAARRAGSPLTPAISGQRSRPWPIANARPGWRKITYEPGKASWEKWEASKMLLVIKRIEELRTLGSAPGGDVQAQAALLDAR